MARGWACIADFQFSGAIRNGAVQIQPATLGSLVFPEEAAAWIESHRALGRDPRHERRPAGCMATLATIARLTDGDGGALIRLHGGRSPQNA
jgi:hypothetical protein